MKSYGTRVSFTLFHTRRLKMLGYRPTIYQGLLSQTNFHIHCSIFKSADINTNYELYFLLFSGTAIYANLWAVMHDKYYWKDPNEFRPERFLDNDGQFRRDDRCVPFSLGKRYCIGQVS